MSNNTCNICCDNYNKSTREEICCCYCDFTACRSCCETYILSETIPKCMNPQCGKEWSRKFIRENFTNVFINTKFKNHIESILFDQEKALMPATQPIIEEKIRKNNIKKEIAHIDALLQDLFVEKRKLERSLYLNEIEDNSAVKNTSNYVRACSAEGCRGFLSSQWKCGICEQWTCPECHELKGLDRHCEHTCDPNNVETAKLLSKDTKSCPKCQAKIFKIDGCFSGSTPILMWDLSTKMAQDIVVGDILVGDDGEKRIVENLVCGMDQMYEIEQDKGMHYIVNSKHTLVLQSNKYSNSNDNDNDYVYNHDSSNVILIIVDDYLRLDEHYRNKLYGIKINKHFDNYIRTKIGVVSLGKGKYYGWSVNKNNRFLLADRTVVKNCDQMWCTQCHTAFSWKTGAIQTNIHNPHYYEWQRKNGGAPRVAGDIECGQDLTHNTSEILRNVIINGKHQSLLTYQRVGLQDYYTLNDKSNVLVEIIRRTIHNIRTELPQFRTNHLEKNQELRVHYLSNDIDEETFKMLIQRNDKKHRKNNEISQVIQVSITANTDIVFRIIDNLKKSAPGEDKFDELMLEFHGVREYCNEIFKDISFAYSCVQYGFDDKFAFKSTFKKGRAK